MTETSCIPPDFKFWSHMPEWHLHEALALSMGKAPEELNSAEYYNSLDRSPVGIEFRRRRELAVRCMGSQVRHRLPDPIEPEAFIAWTDRVGMSIPDELRSAVEQVFYSDFPIGGPAPSVLADFSETDDWRGTPAAPEPGNSKPLSTRERESMLKIIAAMAVCGYKFKPGAAKNAATKEIADDVANVGLSLDEDTVRKYLAEASALLAGSFQSF